MAEGVLIVAETAQGELPSINAELIGVGRQLADQLGEPLSAAILGSGVGGLASQLGALGADKVYMVDSPALAKYENDTYVPALAAVVQQAAPRAVILGQSFTGVDLAGRLAVGLGTGAQADCTDLRFDDEKHLVMVRPVYGGNAIAEYVAEGPLGVATIRPKAFEPAQPQEGRRAELVTVELPAVQPKVKVGEPVQREAGGLRLEDAKIIVSGGRGLGSREAFDQYLAPLAQVLRAPIGASRAAVDSGYADPQLQIGQTGKVVAPNLYIAVAISGALQHWAGMSGAKNIVVINKDPDAALFKLGHFGVVGDYKKVVPALTEKLKELMK